MTPPHEMRLPELRAEIARLERVEHDELALADKAYDVALEREHATAAYDAAERAAELARHLPHDRP